MTTLNESPMLTSPAAGAPSVLATLARNVAEWIARVRRRRVARRRAAETRASLRALDDRGLRDLALSRDEIASIAAEASGEAPCTRIRVAAACRRVRTALSARAADST